MYPMMHRPIDLVNPLEVPLTVSTRHKESEKLAKDVEEFIQKGNKIDIIPSGISGISGIADNDRKYLTAAQKARLDRRNKNE